MGCRVGFSSAFWRHLCPPRSIALGVGPGGCGAGDVAVRAPFSCPQAAGGMWLRAGCPCRPHTAGLRAGCPLAQFLLALELRFCFFVFFKSLFLPVAADAGREGMRDGKGCGKRCRKRCGMGSAARRGGRRHGPAARCHRPRPLRRPLRPLHRSHILSSAGK